MASPFAKSNSKASLMRELDLSGVEGERIYNLLKKDAECGRDGLSHNFEALTDLSKLRNVLMPFRWDDLQETYRYNERMAMVQRATCETQAYYQQGVWETSVLQDNWVADWFLWHSFRFRDNRKTVAAMRAPEESRVFVADLAVYEKNGYKGAVCEIEAETVPA
ncbi:hypothetical protein N0V90_013200 [Kalmusia sp. IMI 367209]|nr:hypothetical protein N0V90_013200 [Kalmusia sp. IMI 367209]